jgi:hypothetical protein
MKITIIANDENEVKDAIHILDKIESALRSRDIEYRITEVSRDNGYSWSISTHKREEDRLGEA